MLKQTAETDDTLMERKHLILRLDGITGITVTSI
jgi:hypothetical protein